MSDYLGTDFDDMGEDWREEYHNTMDQSDTIHLTFTGVYAGRPMCGINKQDAAEKGHRFSHAMYTKNLDNPDICPACLEFWNQDLSDLDE